MVVDLLDVIEIEHKQPIQYQKHTQPSSDPNHYAQALHV